MSNDAATVPHAVLVIAGGHEVLVDVPDLELVGGVAWKLGNRGYAQRSTTVPGRKKPVTLMMHRVIMQPPPGLEVDHINGVKLDNRRANLRVCTRGENQRNVRPRWGRSRFRGVRRFGEKWGAKIQFQRKEFWLGTFATEAEAAHAYDDAARRYFGEFAALNFPAGPNA